jgi:single-stranded-DNA-specific exonuclease
MVKFGGHAMAAGLSLEEARFEEFQQRFGELVTEWLEAYQGAPAHRAYAAPEWSGRSLSACRRRWAQRRSLSLEEARFEEFQQRFGELVTEWLDPALLQGEVVSG